MDDKIETAKQIKMNEFQLAVEIVNVYSVNQGDDDRSNGDPKWWFDNENQAKNVAKERGWHGGNAPVVNHKAIKDNLNNYYLLAKQYEIQMNVGPDDIAEKKAKAMAKLTLDEQKLLGIK